ncbi:hypothetical protein ACELLULO517_22815 [Acidisoma cellulosilytica]|uniref:Uncharacterized protein n=1 Tax=Acidisoma cellulosilyticum TaxID=2802395 RepID=A0A963Z5B0_9PROT|nr:DUF4286 family protein [Acidisoma cellulosilyticum]MCB8883099.1 hypothetical protein [Acidisoma cellulosilyticum]
MRRLFINTCLATAMLFGTAHAGFAAEKQKYFFMFFSNPVKGHEKDYLHWYTGQHIHDLLNIDGIVAAQFYELGDQQFYGTHPQKYMMIWEIETTDLKSAFDRVKKGLATGTTVTKDSFLDNDTGNSMTFTPITNRVTQDEVLGKSVDQVRSIATEGQVTSADN